MARTQTLAQLRAHIPVLQAALAAERTAPMSRAETCAAIERQVAAHATVGEGRLRYHVVGVGHGGDLGDALRVRAAPDGHIDLLPMLVSILGADALTVTLCSYLPADDDGSTVADRAARIREIEAELFEVECAEEAAIEAIEATGASVDRRADASPLAVLGMHP